MGTNEYREKLDAYLDGKQDEMLADLSALIRIDSTKGEAAEGKPFGEGPAAAVAAMQGLLEKYGLRVTNYDNYVVTGDLDGEGEKALDILAHLDVVPVSDEWTVTAPFEPKVVGDRIYGRGTCDDKGPAIAAVYAVRAIRELGIPLKRGVRLIFGSDEECGSSDLEYYYAREKEAEYTFTPDGDFPVINIEKARLAKAFRAACTSGEALPKLVRLTGGDKANVVPGRAEVLVAGLDEAAAAPILDECAKATGAAYSSEHAADGLLIRVKGRTGHASTPEMGINAVTALLELIARLPLADSEAVKRLRALRDLFPHGDTCGEALGVKMADEISGELTMSLDVLHYDGQEVCGEFDCRAPLCATDENLTEKVREDLAGAGLTMDEGAMRPAHHVSADSDFVRTLLDSYERNFGKKGKPLAIGGGTYVHELERGVAFGCSIEGVDTHMHGDDEFMEIPVMMLSAKIFADTIVRLCN